MTVRLDALCVPFMTGLNWGILPMKTLEFRVKDIHENTFDEHELLVSPVEIGLEIEEAQIVKPINGNIQLVRRVNEVYVKANLSTLIEIICRRCTKRFGAEVAAEIELQFYPAEKPEQVEPYFLDVGERYYSGETIDLSDEVRQAPFSSKFQFGRYVQNQCAGLCPHCGVDRNSTPCSCHEPEESFPRHLRHWEIFLNVTKRAVGK